MPYISNMTKPSNTNSAAREAGRKWIISIYNEAKGLRERIAGDFTLDEAFALVHREWIVDRKPILNKEAFWSFQLDNHGLPEFYSFTAPSRPMTDAEFEQWKAGLRKVNVRPAARPLTTDWEGLESAYALPKGRISGIHIEATNRQAWIKGPQ